MREILFRGKSCENGDWCEGTLVIHKYYRSSSEEKDCRIVDMIYGIDDDGFAYYHSGCDESCDPKTIGQFTGLVDKNGKKVFEGDILSIECYDGGSLFEPSCTWHENAEVIWSQEHFGWYAKFADEELSLWEYDDSKTIEVIGNIHDNPELMEVEKR